MSEKLDEIVAGPDSPRPRLRTRVRRWVVAFFFSLMMICFYRAQDIIQWILPGLSSLF